MVRIPLPLHDKYLSDAQCRIFEQAWHLNRFDAAMSEFSISSIDPNIRALHIWALASEADSGVFIDDVPQSAAKALRLWGELYEDVPEGPHKDAFNDAVRSLYDRASQFAEEVGIPMPFVGEPGSSAEWAEHAKALSPLDATEAYRNAAEAAKIEGVSPQPFLTQAVLKAASGQDWERSEHELREILFGLGKKPSEEDNENARKAAWFLLRIAVQRKDDLLLSEVWAQANSVVFGFPELSMILPEVMGFAIERDNHLIGRRLWNVLQKDRGANSHMYRTLEFHEQIYAKAERKYKKKLFGLF